MKAILDDFSRNKVRTFLTSLGILIGVSSVVLLMAFGLGLKKYIADQFESLGTNLIIVLPGKIFSNGRFRQGGSPAVSIQFDEKDINLLKKIRKADYVVPVFTKATTLTAGTKSELSDIFITSADIFPVRNFTAELGRLFDKSDLDKRSKIVVMGPKIAEKLYGSSQNAVGQLVKINKQGFRIVGVLKSKGGGGMGGPDFDSFTYIPYTSAVSLNPGKKFVTFYIKAPNAEIIPEIKAEIKTTMLKRYKDDDFSIAEQTEILSAISSIFSILNLVLVAIAAISLIVGGIGIMNIMYVTVIERIREIGIRRALGATQKDILWQFLSESVILSLFGGVLGLSLSYIVVLIVQKWFPAYIDSYSVLISLGVSSAIGIIFGVFPARKAAMLSPIEAIRYE
jgi:putative ABC transport system permease protein